MTLLKKSFALVLIFLLRWAHKNVYMSKKIFNKTFMPQKLGIVTFQILQGKNQRKLNYCDFKILVNAKKCFLSYKPVYY